MSYWLEYRISYNFRFITISDFFYINEFNITYAFIKNKIKFKVVVGIN